MYFHLQSDYDDDFEGDDNDSASAHSMSDGASEVTARAYPKENLPKDSTVAELMHAMEKENKQVLEYKERSINMIQVSG